MDGEIAVPTDPCTVCVDGVTVGGPMSKVTVAVAVPPEAVAVTVTVAVDATVGVPEITPVDELMINPDGREPAGTE